MGKFGREESQNSQEGRGWWSLGMRGRLLALLRRGGA